MFETSLTHHMAQQKQCIEQSNAWQNFSLGISCDADASQGRLQLFS